MPSIHIAEDVFGDYIEQAGGYSEAKDLVKQWVREGPPKVETPNE